ncbi:MAG: exodeoxyribonuclease V subunit alpha [Desulfobacula sp.]|nr:exodeoxyribonuclease V subunit alpha [Desulfobacula sp.]
MGKIFFETNPIVLASCALVSKMLNQGHICVDIHEMGKISQVISTKDNIAFTLPDAKVWRSSLIESKMVSKDPKTPLVIDEDDRLYLAKYYDFQLRLTHNIIIRIKSQSLGLDQSVLEKIIDQVIPAKTKPVLKQQKAVKNAILKPLTIISGGPGTGKTFVTNAIKQACLLMAKQQGMPALNIICTAPTGKAASKMEEGRTIHSILKPLRHRPGFNFNKDNLLQVDVMIIDEASMVDMSLLTRLLEAIPLTAKVIVLGDKDQLSSVQAGSVFADICRAQQMMPYIHALNHNFRSSGKSGIQSLAAAINKNDPDKVEQILTDDDYSDVIFEKFDKNIGIEKLLKPYIKKGYHPIQNARNDEVALRNLDSFRILCAHNFGDTGTLQINHVCEKILRSQGNFGIQKKSFRGIIMVNTNDYQKGLFNGDTGITAEQDTKRMVLFSSFDGKIKQFRYKDLPGHDMAFAITVHKSQGSEFGTVLLVMPEKMSPVMTRQLLYTGVTRAKNKVVVFGRIDVVKAAVGLDTKRNSGIEGHLKQEL